MAPSDQRIGRCPRLVVPPPSLSIHQVEKVVLFFLSKQGELAQQLLDARQAPPTPSHQGGGGGEDGFFIGNGREDGAGAGGGAGAGAGDGGLVTLARETNRHGIYCSIGRQIAELMRFLQLNGGGDARGHTRLNLEVSLLFVGGGVAVVVVCLLRVCRPQAEKKGLCVLCVLGVPQPPCQQQRKCARALAVKEERCRKIRGTLFVGAGVEVVGCSFGCCRLSRKCMVGNEPVPRPKMQQ